MARITIPKMEDSGHTPETVFSQIMMFANSATQQLSVGHIKNDLKDATGTFLTMGPLLSGKKS